MVECFVFLRPLGLRLLKGDTATNVLKPAVVETGATIQVPIFVNEGDVVRIDARTGAYIERVKE